MLVILMSGSQEYKNMRASGFRNYFVVCEVTPILVFFVLEAYTSVIHFNSECCPRLTEEPENIFIYLTPGEALTWGRLEVRDWSPL